MSIPTSAVGMGFIGSFLASQLPPANRNALAVLFLDNGTGVAPFGHYQWSDGQNWNDFTLGSANWGSIGGSLASQTDLVAALAAKGPFATYLLNGNNAITKAAHANRMGFIADAGSTTQTFANHVTSGASDGDTFILYNKGNGIVTATGAISAQPGMKMTARKGEVLEAIFDNAADAWVSTTPDYNTVQQNSQSANYITTILDAGRDVIHPLADNNARTFTIDAQANVPYDAGTVIGFVNLSPAVLTIAIAGTDTLTLAGTGTNGSRALAQNGMCIAKLMPNKTSWVISGPGLT